MPANLIASAGSASITVRTSTSSLPPSTQTSNAVPFLVTAVTPTLTGVSPTSGYAKYYQPYLLTLTGTNFQGTSQVLVNGLVHPATFVSSTSMSLQLTAADIANPGTLNIAVRNAAPSGQPTNTEQTFHQQGRHHGAGQHHQRRRHRLAQLGRSCSPSPSTDTGGPGVQMTRTTASASRRPS